jgi:uncharacterized protein (DUF1330 family)
MLYITVHLYGRNGNPGEFREYEKKALDIFRRHGGEVVVAYTPAPGSGTGDVPDEIQVLRIKDKNALDGFMGDPDRVGMAAERESVLRRTEVFLSDRIVQY